MPEIAIVLNPRAGRGAGQKMRPRLEKWLAAESMDAQILVTEHRGHATELARAATGNGAEIVVAAGGDGTLGEVLNGIWGTNVKLGILPLGTGNDFARTLSIGADLELGLKVLKDGFSRRVDVGTVEIEGKSRFFLNVAGAGFDSRCAMRINEHRPQILSKMSGPSAYLVAVASELMSLKSAQLKLELDGKLIEERAVLCAIANAKSYGGGMKVAPDAQIDDGLLDVCLIKDLGALQFARAFPGVFRGKHIHHPKVEMFRASKVTLESEPPLPVLVDGDIFGVTPAQFEIFAGAVEVVAPLEG
ncbi:MAG TPA: diacylglycerol kinase family protein [Abditibacterium sp.]|jgi:diacylglycerol kinase (ATP)